MIRTKYFCFRPARARGRWLGAIVIALTVVMGIQANADSGLQETALAPRSGPRGATMFSSLPAEQTA